MPIGNVIRNRLNLKTQKTRDGYVIPAAELSKLDRLYEKYGVAGKEDNEVSEENQRGVHYDPIDPIIP
jgi:hypothetical protein